MKKKMIAYALGMCMVVNMALPIGAQPGTAEAIEAAGDEGSEEAIEASGDEGSEDSSFEETLDGDVEAETSVSAEEDVMAGDDAGAADDAEETVHAYRRRPHVIYSWLPQIGGFRFAE